MKSDVRIVIDEKLLANLIGSKGNMPYTYEYMTEEEWEMCGGMYNPYLTPQDIQTARENVATKDRNCPKCRVGWKVDQDGERCWSCDEFGDVGVAK